MAALVAIGYPDQDAAAQARAAVWQLEENLIIQADEVAVVSKKLQEALRPATQARD